MQTVSEKSALTDDGRRDNIWIMDTTWLQNLSFPFGKAEVNNCKMINTETLKQEVHRDSESQLRVIQGEKAFPLHNPLGIVKIIYLYNVCSFKWFQVDP